MMEPDRPVPDLDPLVQRVLTGEVSTDDPAVQSRLLSDESFRRRLDTTPVP